MTNSAEHRPLDLRLDGRVVVLTGASLGLGQALAEALRTAGARLVLAARHTEELQAQAAEGEHVVRCDVTDEQDRTGLVDATLDAFGRVDALVNNAGFARSAPATEEEQHDVRRTLETNLSAPFHLCRLFGAQMLEQGSGSIVNVASVSAHRVMNRYPLASYTAAKAALVALTRELAWQWGRGGVRVNAVAPGWFPTRMNGFLQDPDQAGWVADHTSLGRSGAVPEIAGPVLFLLSPASSYVTGQMLAVDGGWI